MRAVTRSKAVVAGGNICPEHSAEVQYPKKVGILKQMGGGIQKPKEPRSIP
jgi:hypothetical protein